MLRASAFEANGGGLKILCSFSVLDWRVMPADRIRFGDFELDPEGYELRRSGAPVRLERIPMELLLLLAANSGRLVPRSALVERVWGKDHFLDGDGAINTAVRKLRVALGDSVEKPRFIETVTGKGYRFMANALNAEASGVAARLAGEARTGDRCRRTLLAVFPFENFSKDPRDAYLSDGITEELITCLGETAPAELGVFGRTTATECHRRGMTLEQMGHELGAQFVIEGSVRGSGERVRINVRLVQVSDQVQVWAKSYEREIGDLLAWQWEVAREIAGEVKIAVPTEVPLRRARSRQVDPQAYEYYLRGLHRWNKRTPPGCIQAIALFEQAIDIDPAYALPYAGMADAFILLAIHGARSPQDTYPKARAAAIKALEIDPMLAEAHAALADISKGFDWDWRQAEASYREAIRLNASYGLAHQWYANFLSIRERHEEAIREAEEARHADPLSAPAAGFVAFTLYRARRFDAALKEAAKAVDLNPPSPVVNWFLALIHLQRGDYALAQETSTTAFRESHEGGMFLATLGHVLGRAGKREAALEVARTLERRSAEQYISPFDICIAHAGFDDHAALAWLEKAVEQRVMRITELGMPLFDGLRHRAKFKELSAVLASEG
jgi:TolB-like protein/tetratricopeptide (TPR) repeat protein